MSDIFILIATCVLVAPCFVKAAPFQSNTTDGAETFKEALAIGGTQGYIIVSGGFTKPEQTSTVSCYAYDIAEGTMASLPDLPFPPRYGHGSATFMENVYISSGYTIVPQETGLNQTLRLTKTGWIEGPSLTTMAWDRANMVTTNDSIYVTGCQSKHLEMLSCGRGVFTWQPMEDSSLMHYYSASAELNGFIYVCGTGTTPSNLCERYNTRTDTWTPIQSMTLARNRHEMVSLKNKLYVIGGVKGNNEVYDPATDTWTFFSSVPNQLYLATAATDGDKIYLIGGSSTITATQIVSDVSVYYPEFDIWQPKVPYPFPIAAAASTFVKALP